MSEQTRMTGENEDDQGKRGLKEMALEENEKNGCNEQNAHNAHRKKKIAPIAVTIFVLAYFVIYFGFLIAVIPFAMVRNLLCVIPLVLGIGMIAVCLQRLKEIDKGEEDDLSKY